MPRVLVVFSSLFGAGASLADILDSELTTLGAEVRVRRVEEVALTGDVQPAAAIAEVATAADLEWADGYVFSSPSHTGLLSASIKAFIDENHDAAVAGAFLNKSFTALATGGFTHAGQERVVDDLNAVAAAWGCLVVSPSTANAELNTLDGNPYGLSFVLQHGKLADPDVARQIVRIHFTRFVAVTEALEGLRAPKPAASGPAMASDVFS